MDARNGVLQSAAVTWRRRRRAAGPSQLDRARWASGAFTYDEGAFLVRSGGWSRATLRRYRHQARRVMLLGNLGIAAGRRLGSTPGARPEVARTSVFAPSESARGASS